MENCRFMEVQTKKRGWIIFAALLLLLCLTYAGRDWIGTALKAESGKEHVQIEFDAKTAGDHVDKLLKSRWDNIFFHIQFAPDETAFVHVEFKNENLCDLLSIPEWIAASLPEDLLLEMQICPRLEKDGAVQLEMHTLRLNGAEMPPMVGEALCAGVSHRINAALEKEGIRIKSLVIEGEMLKIRTEKSSGQ